MPTQTSIREEIIQRLRRRPFTGFAVQMRDGQRFHIVRRFQMAVGLTTAVIGDATGDRARTVQLSDITSVSDQPASRPDDR